MKTYPTKDKLAKTGSNLRGNPLVAHDSKLLGLHEILEREARAYRRQVKKLFSKADLRRADEIVSRAKKEWHSSNLGLGSDARKWDANKAKFRKQINRDLVRALPGYREWQNLARKYHRENRKLVKLHLAALNQKGVHLGWGDLSVDLSPETDEFTPPYAAWRAYQDTVGPPYPIVQQHSSVVPSSGHMINSFAFMHDDDGNIGNEVWGVNQRLEYESVVACGVTFTTPRAGRLRIAASLRNHQNRITYSLRDCFGLSNATLDVSVALWLEIVWSNGTYREHNRPLLEGGYVSHGPDVFIHMPELDTASPYTLQSITSTFPANLDLQILVGCRVSIWSDINDMVSYVNALLWWELTKLSVSVIDP